MDINTQQRAVSPNMEQNRQLNSVVCNSVVLYQDYKQIEMGLKQIKFQNQNLQYNIQIEKQRILKNSKFSNFNHSVEKQSQVKQARRNNIIGRQSMIVNKSKIFHSSSINKSQVYDHKLIVTIQELQKLVELHRHNERGYKTQINSLNEQITYMKRIIEERQTLIARHTHEVQVVRESSQSSETILLKQQIHALHQKYRQEIQRIQKTVSTNQTIILQRKIQQFQSLLIEKDTTIKRLEHQLQAFSGKTQKGGDKELRQKLISMELEITKLSQGLQRKQKQKMEYEERIRQLSQKYDDLIFSTKNKQQDGKLIKQNSELKVQVQILQSQIERLKAQSKVSFEGSSQLKKIEAEKLQLQQLIINLRKQIEILNKRIEKMKLESQEAARYFQQKQVQERKRQKRIQQLAGTIRERDSEIFSLRQQLRKSRKISLVETGISQEFNRKMQQMMEENQKLTLEIHNYRSSYQQIRVKYDESQHIIQSNQFKLQNYSQLELQIQQLKKQNIQLSMNKFPLFEQPTKKSGDSGRDQQNNRLKAQLVKNQQQVRILLDQIERLKYQISTSSNQNNKIRQLQSKIMQYESQINRLTIFQSRFYQQEQKIKQILSREDSEIVRLQNQIKILQAEIERLNYQIRNPSQRKPIDNSSQYQQQIQSLRLQINRLSVFQKRAISIQSQFSLQIARLQNQIKFFKAQNERLHMTIREPQQTFEKQDYQRQIYEMRIEIQRLVIIERNFFSLEQQLIHLHNQLSNYQTEVSRLNIDLEKMRENSEKQTYQRQIYGMKIQIQRLIVIEQNFFSLEQQFTHLQRQINNYQAEISRLNIQLEKTRKSYGQQSSETKNQYNEKSQRQILRLRQQVDRLIIIQRNFFEIQAKLNYLQSHPIKQKQIDQQTKSKLKQAQHGILILQKQIERLRKFESRFSEIQRVQKLEQRFQIIQRIINEVLRVYRSSSLNYELSQFVNIPHYLSELISIFISLHRKNFQLNQLIASFESQIFELKRINVEVQQSKYEGGNLTEDLEALEDKILELKSSNEVYMRMNNALSSKLQSSQLQRQFIFNQFITAKGELEKLEHQNIIKQTISQHSQNASIDIELLRARIYQIESVTAGSMDKLREYYQHIQNDVQFQLKDMRNTVDLLESNNQGTSRQNAGKYKIIVTKLMMEVSQLQSSFKVFENTVNLNIRTTNEEIIKITEVMNERINKIIEQSKSDEGVYNDKNRLQIQLSDAEAYINSLENEKDQLSNKINQLRTQFDLMKLESNRVQISYSQAVGKSENLQRERDRLQITIKRIQDQKSQIQRQLSLKIKQNFVQAQSQEQLNFLGNKLKDAETQINRLRAEKDQINLSQSVISQLTIKYEQSVYEKNRIQKSLIDAQLKVKKLQEEKILIEQNNQQLHHRCEALQRQLFLMNQRVNMGANRDEQGEVEIIVRERDQILGKLVQAEQYIFKIQQEIKNLVEENRRLFEACARLEEVEQEYQKAIHQRARIEQSLLQVETNLKSISLQKTRIETQYSHIKNQYATLQKSVYLKDSNAGEGKAAIQEAQSKLQLAQATIRKNQQQKIELSRNIQRLSQENQRRAQLESSLSQLKLENTRILAQKNQKQSVLHQIQTQLITIQHEKQELDYANHSLMGKYHELEIKASQLEHVNQSQQVLSQLQMVTNKLIEAEQYIYTLENERNLLVTDLQNLSNEGRSVQIQRLIAQANNENQMLLNQNRNLQAIIHQLQVKITSLSSERQNLLKENILLKNKSEQLQTTIDTHLLENKTEVYSSSQRHAIRSTIETYPPEFQQNKNKLNQLIYKLTQAQKYIFSMEEQKVVIVADIEKLIAQNGNLIDRVNFLQENVHFLEQQQTLSKSKGLADHQSELQHLENQKLILNRQKNQFRQEFQNLRTVLHQLQIEKAQIEEKYLESEKKNKLEERAQDSVQPITQSRNEQILSLINQLNEKTRFLNEQIDKNQGLTQRIFQADAYILELETKINNFSQEREASEAEINKLKGGIQSLRISNDQFKNNNYNLSSKLEKLMMQGQDEIIKSYQQQLVTCKQQIERQNHYIQTVENQNREMFEVQQHLRQEKQQLESRLNRIDHPHVSNLQISRQQMERLSQANYQLQYQVSSTKKLNASIVQFLGQFNGYIAGLEALQIIPEQVSGQYVFRDLPVIENLCQNVLFKLRQAFSQGLDRENKIRELEIRKRQADSIEKRYEQLIQQLVEQEHTNKEYQLQVNELQDQIQRHKNQLQEFTHQISVKQSQNKGADTQQINRFIQECVGQIDRIENNSVILADELNAISQNQRILQQSISFPPERLAQLRELEQKLLKNEQEIREDQEEDRKAINYIKEVIENESPGLGDKSKINQYLDRLEKNITQRLHSSDSPSSSSPKASQGVHSPRVGHRRDISGSGGLQFDRKEDLEREIRQLSQHMQIYHRQWRRRSEVCLNMALTAINETEMAYEACDHLNRQHPQVASQYPDLIEKIIQINKILNEIGNQLKPDEVFNGQIQVNPQYTHIRQEISISPNFMQLMSSNLQREQPTDQQFQYALKNLKHSIDEKIPERKTFDEIIQTDTDPKPLIDFLLRSNNLSSVDLVALKQKVASIRAREKSQSQKIVSQNMKKITGIVNQVNSENLNSKNVDNVINTMITNYSPTRLHNLFKHSSDKEIAMAMQELCQIERQQEMHDYKLQSSSFIINQIEQRKIKFYQAPTRISEDIHAAILKLISARNDQQFLNFIEELFETIFMIEQKFETIIRKKDQQYRQHTAKMNQIFNRSQSEQSEEFYGLDSANKRSPVQTNLRFQYETNLIRRQEDMPRR